MARVLVTCWPMPGHLNSQVGIADRLRARGHEVSFYSGETARPTLDRAGFELHPPAAVDERRILGEIERVDRDPQARPDPRLLRSVFRTWLVDSIPDQIADLEPLIAERRPDVIICDLSMWAPFLILGEKHGIAVALSSTFMGPLPPGRDVPPAGLGLPQTSRRGVRGLYRGIGALVELGGRPLRREIDRLRAAHGLPPLGMSVNEFTGRLPLYIVGNIPALDYGRRDVPPSVHYVGPVVWHPPDSGEVDDWLAQIPDERPWVHVTESTITAGDPFLLRAAAEGLAGRDCEAILTSGGHRDPESLGLPKAANVHVTGWVSHAELLPRCACVVTAGGPATIIAALRAGAPLVVVPTTWDKPDNARRVEHAGAGVRLPARGLTAGALRDAVEKVLGDPSYRHRARELAGELKAAPGADGAADLIEGLLPGAGESKGTRS